MKEEPHQTVDDLLAELKYLPANPTVATRIKRDRRSVTMAEPLRCRGWAGSWAASGLLAVDVPFGKS
jgi:hypothetical protein